MYGDQWRELLFRSQEQDACADADDRATSLQKEKDKLEEQIKVRRVLDPFTPKIGQVQNWKKKSKFHFAEISRNKQNQIKVLLNSFHLNGHMIVWFHPQTLS